MPAAAQQRDNRPPPQYDLRPAEIADLRAWSSKFHYAPEMEFVSLTRRAPSTYKNVDAAGWLENIDHPFDHAYVRDRWGGGHYLVVATQINTKGEQEEVSRGFFKIQGNPKAYPGSDGQPLLFPDDDNGDDDYSMPGWPPRNGGNGRLRMRPPGMRGGNGHGDEDMSWSPLGYGALDSAPAPRRRESNFEDLAAVAAQVANSSSSEKMVDMLKEFAESATAQARADRDASIAEVAEYRKQMLAVQNERDAPMKNAVEFYRQQMDQMRNAHMITLDQMRTSHATTLDTMQKEHRQQLDSLRSASDAGLKSTEQRYQTTIDALKDQAKAALETAEKRHRDTIDALRADALSRENAVRDSARIERDGMLRDLSESREQYRVLQAETARRESELRSEYNARLQQFQTDVDRRERELRQEHQREVERIRQDTQERERMLRESLSAQYTGQVDSQRDRATDVREEYNRARADWDRIRGEMLAEQNRLRDELKNDGERRASEASAREEARYTPQLLHKDGEIARLNAELERVRAEAEKARTEANERKDPVSQMQEMAALKRSMDDIMGVAEKGEEVPQDGLGKFMHYADKLGSSVLGPIMGTVTEGMKASRAQKEAAAAQTQAIMQQAMAAPRQVAVPMLSGVPQQGAPRFVQQAPPQLPPQQMVPQQMVPQQMPMPQQTQPMPPPQMRRPRPQQARSAQVRPAPQPQAPVINQPTPAVTFGPVPAQPQVVAQPPQQPQPQVVQPQVVPPPQVVPQVVTQAPVPQHVVVPPQAPVVEVVDTSVPLAPEEEGVTSEFEVTDMPDETRQIIMQLDSAIQAGATSREIADSLVAAVTAGYIPAENVKQLVAQDVDILIESLVVGAKALNASNVYSLRGQRFVRELHQLLSAREW